MKLLIENINLIYQENLNLFKKKEKKIKLSVLITLVFLLLAPFFVGITLNNNFSITMSLVGKFDTRHVQGFTVLPLNFFIGLLIFFFLKPFKIYKEIFNLLIFVLIPVFIFILKNSYVDLRIIKLSLGIFTFFLFYQIFLEFNKTLFHFFPKKKILNLLNNFSILIFFLNFFGFLISGKYTTFGLPFFEIYNFYDYYSIFTCSIFLLNLNFDNADRLKIKTIIIFFISLILLTYTQSRSIMFVFLLVIFIHFFIKFLSIFFLTNIKKTISNFYIFKYSINVYILFILFLFMSGFFVDLFYDDDFFKTLSYRNIEIIKLFSNLNYTNLLLPQVTDIVSESFHNQYIELYNWFGIFVIYYIYFFYKIVKKIFNFNYYRIYIILFFYFSIGFLLLPLTHIYSAIILSYILSILSFKLQNTK